MKLKQTIKAALMALVGIALASSSLRTQAQTILTNGFTNGFPNNGATAPYASSGSATWFYWYDFGGSVSNNPSVDANNDPTSGSLDVYLPFGTNGNNALFCGTFANNPGNAYDFGIRANLLVYSNITFDILVDSNQAPFIDATTTNFGRLGVGIINGNYGYQKFSDIFIPKEASNSWVHISVPVDKTQDNLANVPGIVIDGNNYAGYPHVPRHFWIDNVAANAPPAPPPPPPTLSAPQKPIAGLNALGAGAQYDRYQLCTIADAGYGFVGQPSVTYSWTISAFPQSTNANWQAHFFIVSGQPGQYDQAADYNLTNCIFMTIQQNAAGAATFNFRYKTNEDGNSLTGPNGTKSGNAMLFNNLALTNPANTFGWPVMPIANLVNSNGAVGTWSVTFTGDTNVTVTAPSGASTNFAFSAASAALFTSPVALLLGAQPNNPPPSGYGNNPKDVVVFTHFSATGCVSPINEDFLSESNFDTTIWKNQANNTNGLVLVPTNSGYWLNWSLPDAGYSPLVSASLPSKGAWQSLSSLTTYKINGQRSILVPAENLPGSNQNYFSLIQRVYTQLQVLLPGETAAPNTPTGKTGKPDDQFVDNPFSITVNAVDANWNRIPGITDRVRFSSNDPLFVPPNDAPMVNGTLTLSGQFGTSGDWIVTGADVTDTSKQTNNSSVVHVP